MNAAFAEYHDWESAAAYKLLCDQREQYIEQSRRTRNGVVAEFPRGLPANTSYPNHVGQALSISEDVQ